MDYTVELIIETAAPLSEATLEHVAAIGGAAGGNAGQFRLTTTLTISAANIAEAASKASALILARAPGVVVAADVATIEESDRRAAMRDEFVGVSEVAEMLGISRQRVTKLSTRNDFPVAIARLKSGPVWRRGDLSTFAEGWQRKAGRPKKEEAAAA